MQQREGIWQRKLGQDTLANFVKSSRGCPVVVKINTGVNYQGVGTENMIDYKGRRVAAIYPKILDALEVSKHIYVSSNGYGNFKSIQAAIDSIPEGNSQWIRIHVEKGVYREKVNIPKYKEYIMLEGEGSDQTWIEYGDSANDGVHTTESSTTFSCYADNFMARDISFKNTFNGGPSMAQAVAALVAGDKSSFYRCSFVGIQDTLCDLSGRHYYKDCYIEGAIDFIFGQGQSIFERCTISTTSLVQGVGYITAHGRDSKHDWSGFVFKSCNITGSAQTYLGRPWRPYARVIFYESYMANIITPEGWDTWQYDGWDTTFAEVKCRGPGAKRKGRVNWMKMLSDKALKHYTSLRYINRDKWIHSQPT
ncbi:hypothetical protein LUZ61_015137 [Rhynchospora tenuis]|uniref:Pectinesterase n=1 Tax=Rhynchospora tenuis TaxID=198213 RepID=A0AAD5Z2C4_9POAL|nr:hypothetical protein LUZ61_015137 [Rhynchospora tenuis]